MQFSTKQQKALADVERWYRSKTNEQQVFRVFGYAGTGKTTLARHFASNIEGLVLFAAYTGKAAHVLQQSGCEGATTIHSLIYISAEKSKERLKTLKQQLVERTEFLQQQGKDVESDVRVRELKRLVGEEEKSATRPMFRLNNDSPVKGAKLVVIDECSMVDERMAEDLKSFGVPILVLGDPAQLPPVGGEGYFTNAEPDVMLTEIHRQAQDNPIIRLATMAREGRRPSLGGYGDSLVIPKGTITPEQALAADQILVGKNKTRHSINARIRSLKNMPIEHPIVGDRVVCLRNNHELGLLNGAVSDIIAVTVYDSEEIIMTVDTNGRPTDVVAHMAHFLGKELGWWEKREREEFDYGYAMTVHKSQGSQWQNVLLFDESSSFRTDWNRWLYTGITRAAEKLTIVI